VFSPRRTGTHLILVAADEPAGECSPALHPEAQVLNTAGDWVPVTVIAWFKLEEPIRQRITFSVVRWLVQLQQEDGTVGWFQYTDSDLRALNEPRSTGSSSASGK
jgi:hypothetical protein